MDTFDAYHDRYTNIVMERTPEGILHIRFHCDGHSLKWCKTAHAEFEHAFRAIGRDRENRVIIMSGTGEDFCGDPDYESWGLNDAGETDGDPDVDWSGAISWEGRQLVLSLLDIEVPIIAAVHGRATRHAEIPLLSDIVLASETAQFGDDFHLPCGIVPGDGIQILWTELLGPNRGRYLQFAHEILDAHEAHRVGIVGEVLPSGELLDRAWVLARQLAGQRTQVLRNSRLACIRSLRKAFDDALIVGFGLEFSA
jgi:enoyl-CoA hydratase/carnithine racemase